MLMANTEHLDLALISGLERDEPLTLYWPMDGIPVGQLVIVALKTDFHDCGELEAMQAGWFLRQFGPPNRKLGVNAIRTKRRIDSRCGHKTIEA
jgi:hypothetical protein